VHSHFLAQVKTMANSKPPETELHTLYLSNTVWGELKRRAVMDGSTASQIADYVLQTFLKYKPAVRLPQRRPPLGTREILSRRNLHLGKDTWERIAGVAQEGKYSVSILTEYLLRKYLALVISDDLKHR
jgi:hypothetical protein